MEIGPSACAKVQLFERDVPWLCGKLSILQLTPYTGTIQKELVSPQRGSTLQKRSSLVVRDAQYLKLSTLQFMNCYIFMHCGILTRKCQLAADPNGQINNFLPYPFFPFYL
jgi:hypothetical protein